MDGSPDLFIWGGDVVYADLFMTPFMEYGEGYLSLDHVRETYDKIK